MYCVEKKGQKHSNLEGLQKIYIWALFASQYTICLMLPSYMLLYAKGLATWHSSSRILPPSPKTSLPKILFLHPRPYMEINMICQHASKLERSTHLNSLASLTRSSSKRSREGVLAVFSHLWTSCPYPSRQEYKRTRGQMDKITKDQKDKRASFAHLWTSWGICPCPWGPWWGRGARGHSRAWSAPAVPAPPPSSL